MKFDKLGFDIGLHVEEECPATGIPKQVGGKAAIKALNGSFISG